MRIKCKVLLGIFFLAIMLIPGLLVSADAAPPESPGGNNLDPGEGSTMVQMVAEEVIIDVGATRDGYSVVESYGDYVYGNKLAFNCTFWMVNQGEETENLAVRFPLRMEYETGEIKIQSIKIDGNPVTWREDEYVYGETNWAHFDVTFPPGEEVEIKVVYTSLTKPYKGYAQERITYILETGAGWYGPIGKGKIILRLPYPATKENVILKAAITGARFTGSDVVWEFTDLEPAREDNFHVSVVATDTWLSIVSDREKLEEHPNNSSALIRLGKAIYSICVEERFRSLDYQEELFQVGLEALLKGISFLPEDLDLRVLYSEFLMADLKDDNYPILLEQLDYIESIDPDHWIFDAKSYSSGYLEYMSTLEARENPAVTEPSSTQEPALPPTTTLTPEPTHSEPPTDTPQPTTAPKPTGIPPEPVEPVRSWSFLLFIAGFAVLVVIGLAVFFVIRRR